MDYILNVSKFVKEIVEEILHSKQDMISLNEYCISRLKCRYPALSDLEINDKLDEIVEKVTFHINRRNEYCKNKDITPEYEFNTYPPKVLFRYSVRHKEPQLISYLRKQNRILLNAINDMSWQSFEYLCKHLLKINGVDPIKLTKVNQEGIDFLGLYNINNCGSSVIIPKNFKIKIVGQVKHYLDKIGPKQVRAFDTYCKDVKNEQKDIVKNFPAWFTKTKIPVLGIFMTTSDFTKAASRYTKKEWMILRNGEQIVENLIQSPCSKDWVKNEDGHLIFDKTLFLKFFGEERKLNLFQDPKMTRRL